MAMQAGVSSSKVLILLGAGLTGSIILKNGRLSEVLLELQELMKGVNEADGSSDRFDAAFLASQIRNLAQEIRDLAVSRPVTIIQGENSSSGGLPGFIVPAAALGAAGYCYMWWKGWSFSDVMFVTKRNMANAVVTVSKQLEQVSSALSATKRHLTQRIENLDGKLDEQREISKQIMHEVTEAKTDLSQIGFDIESIQMMLIGLEGKVELLDNKQDMTNAAIHRLLQIAGGVKDGLCGKFYQETGEKLQYARPTLAFSSSMPVKGLEFLTESSNTPESGDSLAAAILAKDVQGKPTKPTFPKATAIHRSYPGGISVRKESLAL